MTVGNNVQTSMFGALALDTPDAPTAMKLKWNKGTFTVLMRGGVTKQVSGVTASAFGVDKRGKGEGSGWYVTHLPTGICLGWPLGTEAKAKRWVGMIVTATSWESVAPGDTRLTGKLFRFLIETWNDVQRGPDDAPDAVPAPGVKKPASRGRSYKPHA